MSHHKSTPGGIANFTSATGGFYDIVGFDTRFVPQLIPRILH